MEHMKKFIYIALLVNQAVLKIKWLKIGTNKFILVDVSYMNYQQFLGSRLLDAWKSPFMF
jgi:hypothetical protein